MAAEQVKTFLEKLEKDDKAQALFQDREQPQDPEGKIKALADIANKMGFDVTAAEIADYLIKAETARKEKTDAQAAGVQALDDSEVEKASGGAGNKSCKSSFKHKENCWLTDACDSFHISYISYECAHNNLGTHCEREAMMDCQQVIS